MFNKTMSIFLKNMEPSNMLDALQSSQDDIPIFRRLISIAPMHDSTVAVSENEWQPILIHILGIVSKNTESGNERVLLACHAFYALLSTRCHSYFLKSTVRHFQELDSRDLCFLEKRYTISDLELFKLLNIYGYLQANRKETYSDDILLRMFDVIYRNCLTYTRYSYFAYKILYMWLKKTINMRFWYNNIILEQKLEAVIFSNWFNTLNDVCKQNAQIFNIYLQIMSKKYDGFLKYIFEMCVTKMSWQNEIKYTILSEICQLWDNVEAMTTEIFLFGLCTSLTRNSLRFGGTKLYLVILRKLNENEWKKTFGKIVKFFIDRWESGEHKNHNALQSLLKYWLEPTIEMHKDVLIFLWELSSDSQRYFFRSYLQKIAAKLHIELSRIKELDCYINDREEIVRLNAFAALCYRVSIDLVDVNQADPFFLIKRFLWLNANTATISIREGIIKYFRILYSNILKTISIRADCLQSISEFTIWLYEYFLDCFEIGSCYQRKILALNLYNTLLSLTNENLHKSCTHHGEYLRNITIINRYLKTTNSWKFTDKKSLFVLLRLVLDSALDIRQLATSLIVEYFEKDALSAMEKCILYSCTWEHCNSSKFYKIDGGAALMKIIAHWSSFNEVSKHSAAVFSDIEHNNILAYSQYSKFLLDGARHQLAHMKTDILKAVVHNRPFYGVLTALLMIAFRAGPESRILTTQFRMDVLHLLKDAVDFFLSTLSLKISDTAYSSSFAEMGLAINKKIKTSEISDYNYNELQLSPAHQILISCIWMSLKVSCEIASEIGILMQSDTEVRYSMDIIVTVLLKCRHKGVVESAGIAIANLSKHLYNRKEYCELPKIYLTNLLEEDTEKQLHLTRRGAGLSIMFHKLLVSDNRRDRPTVHFAVQTLMRSLSNSSVKAVRNVEIGQDSPWAKRLHFLRALVADKEIHAQLIPYMEDICLICFEYMESDVWTIRNASLQLYGAVVPRLMGQCSGNKGGVLDFGDGYSINHFVTHYPTLADRMLMQLRSVSRIHGTSNTALRSYANIMHTLILLSKMWTGGCDLVDYPSLKFAASCRDLLCNFLINPMMFVRQLAAKAYAALTPSANISSELNSIRWKASSSCDDNLSHGFLLTARYLKEKLTNNMEIASPWQEITENCPLFDSYPNSIRCHDMLKAWQNMYKHKTVVKPCYILETLFLQESKFIASEVFSMDKFNYDNILLLIENVAPSQQIQPGFFQFVELWIRLYTVHIKQKNININPEVIYKILNSNCIEQSIGFLKGLLHYDSILEFILKHLISMKNNCHQLLLDEIITFTLRSIKHVSLQINELEFDEIIEEFNKIKATIAINSSMIRVRNALILAFSKHEMLINEVLSYILDLSMNDNQFIRSTAAEYTELALGRFARLGSDNRLTIMRCCLILLKDEITEIREIVSTSLQKYVFRDDDFAPSHRMQYEEIVYQRLLQDIIRYQLVNNTSISGNLDFIRYFTCAIRDSNSNAIIENPFYHEDIAFYKEESKFLNLYFLYATREYSNDYLSDNKSAYENCCDAIRAIKKRCELQEKIGFNYDDLHAVLYFNEMDYVARKRDIVMQRN